MHCDFRLYSALNCVIFRTSLFKPVTLLWYMSKKDIFYKKPTIERTELPVEIIIVNNFWWGQRLFLFSLLKDAPICWHVIISVILYIKWTEQSLSFKIVKFLVDQQLAFRTVKLIEYFLTTISSSILRSPPDQGCAF